MFHATLLMCVVLAFYSHPNDYIAICILVHVVFCDGSPNLKGTHLDWTLDLESRLDYLVNVATQAEKIAQLTNDAPAITRLGIPSYNWLNDDEHGEMGKHATVFPNGGCLGAR